MFSKHVLPRHPVSTNQTPAFALDRVPVQVQVEARDDLTRFAASKFKSSTHTEAHSAGRSPKD